MQQHPKITVKGVKAALKDSGGSAFTVSLAELPELLGLRKSRPAEKQLGIRLLDALYEEDEWDIILELIPEDMNYRSLQKELK